MDVSKLGGEWHHSDECLCACVTSKPDGHGAVLATFHAALVECEIIEASNMAAFAALARNALDVMMRRGWGVVLNPEAGPMQGWLVELPNASYPMGTKMYDLVNARWKDPFTALVEADAWYREHVEKA